MQDPSNDIPRLVGRLALRDGRLVLLREREFDVERTEVREARDSSARFAALAYNCPDSYTDLVNFNVYVDDATGERIAALAKQRRTTRNAIVREALEHWLGTHGRRTWPKRVLSFEGQPDFPAFETHRADLSAVPTDPFATE
jgi:gamma-glutamyl:cysteine ligase YbdK (ATP-grasp superfamily)